MTFAHAKDGAPAPSSSAKKLAGSGRKRHILANSFLGSGRPLFSQPAIEAGVFQCWRVPIPLMTSIEISACAFI